jgi:type IV pilus assembly protein PilV
MRPGYVTRRKERGISLIESLVALLVLSIGMLGIAALYVSSLRASGSALLRTQAVNFAADMADRIRSNPNAAAAYAGAAADNSCVRGAAVGADCTPAQLAADDLFRWRAAIATVLPDDGNAGTLQGTVAVAGAAVPRTYTIQVTWSEPTEPAPLVYTLTMQI